MSKEIVLKAEEIIKENSVYGGETGFGMCTLSLIDEDGYPTASIITPSKTDGLKWLTFGTMKTQNSVNRIIQCNRASICFSSESYCINLVGEIEIIDSEEVKKEMWYEGLGHHLSGPEDPNYCVLKFNTNRYKIFLDFKEVVGKI
ncbi:pyridoxamine 5'-phosphate oxidase family protein [Enterococcus hulanensis]|uniref:pyridoxamine 5'-phosphate oxidase family protein n=1 Tax=Enterococcus hulanensis TaxID=2559929 RepID=UPI001A9384BA|nr:pyridoxamine 5'-phosphate oxidase family protein [Enterococcus hulanensis]MBO0410162.1 pyridoxamine 5'-phosphate oxidase family protein [Enterococcus hulanensis]